MLATNESSFTWRRSRPEDGLVTRLYLSWSFLNGIMRIAYCMKALCKPISCIPLADRLSGGDWQMLSNSSDSRLYI